MYALHVSFLLLQRQKGPANVRGCFLPFGFFVLDCNMVAVLEIYEDLVIHLEIE